MAAVRRGQGSMKVDVSSGGGPVTTDLPLIAALFLIYFDIKAGYTISWKRSVPGIELEGVVEYKSLPSGLHTVKEDLIYFVHDRYAGLSAFVNAPAAEESRNARMLAVGILVPLSYGRLGRSWKHADNLKTIAQKLVVDTSDTKVLEEYWESHKGHDSTQTYLDSVVESSTNVTFKLPLSQPGRLNKHMRNRSASDGTALLPPGHSLTPHHPAWSLSSLLDTFGPLIFPIYRAALLRKRILISCHAPVQEFCDFVYDLSVLSNIPLAVSNLLSPSAPPQRLRPLFTIGVHDIPYLEEDLRAATAAAETPQLEEDIDEDEEEDESGHGWIACTTDGILAMKDTLYDVLITMPPPHTKDARSKVWPKVESPRGAELKATQRDLRRFRALRWSLSRSSIEQEVPGVAKPSPGLSTNGNGNTNTTTGNDIPSDSLGASSSSLSPPSPPPPNPSQIQDNPLLDLPDTDHITEPLSWAHLAYAGFMWWASAGERRIAIEDEDGVDGVLLEGLDLEPQTPAAGRSRYSLSGSISSLGGSGSGHGSGSGFGLASDGSAKREMAIIAYFHRLTTLTLTTLSNIVDATESDDEDEEQDDARRNGDRAPLRPDVGVEDLNGPVVHVSSADLVRMGLDDWSASDMDFVEDVVRLYFGRRAQVESKNIDICGIRIC